MSETKVESSFNKIVSILEKVSDENFGDAIKEIMSLDVYKVKPNGCFATLVQFLSNSGKNNLIGQFFDELCNQKTTQTADFLVFWLRVSDSENIEIIIEAVERNALNLSGINGLLHAPFAKLVEKCENSIFPEKIEFSGSLSSKEFSEKAPSLSRIKRQSVLVGRVYIAISRIFIPYKFAPKQAPQQAASDDAYSVTLTKAVKLLASSQITTPAVLNEIVNFLNSQVNDTEHKTLYRTPPHPIDCISILETSHIGFDICLVLAIQGLIHASDETNVTSFKQFVKQFASRCNLNGDDIIANIEKAKKNTRLDFAKDTEEDPSLDETTSWDDIPAAPLLQPFDVPEDVKVPYNKPQMITEESAMDEIKSFAGEDKSQWFVGAELKEWRAARLCVAHFMDKLSPDSFTFLE